MIVDGGKACVVVRCIVHCLGYMQRLLMLASLTRNTTVRSISQEQTLISLRLCTCTKEMVVCAVLCLSSCSGLAGHSWGLSICLLDAVTCWHNQQSIFSSDGGLDCFLLVWAEVFMIEVTPQGRQQLLTAHRAALCQGLCTHPNHDSTLEETLCNRNGKRGPQQGVSPSLLSRPTWKHVCVPVRAVADIMI